MTDELFDSIENSNFSDILHATLLEEVEKIRHAIAMYKIEGIQGLRDVFCGAVGSIRDNEEELKKESGIQENQNMFKKLSSLLTAPI